MSLRSVPPFHWRHSHRSFIANQFLSGKSWHWIIHLVPPYMGKIPQDGVNEQIWHISSLVVLHWIRPHTRVQRIYFLFNFYLAHTFFLYFSILRTIYFLTFFDSRPPSFAKLTFCKFKLSNWPFFVRIFSED